MYIWNSFFFLLLSLFDTEERKKECIHISICYGGIRNSEISSMNDNVRTQMRHTSYVNSLRHNMATNDRHLIYFLHGWVKCVFS